MEYCNPDDRFQNYVWDTQSLNQLATDDEMIEQCKQAIGLGHRYYITEVQERELVGFPDRKMNYQDASAWASPESQTLAAMNILGFLRLSCVALLYPHFWILDGSMRILEMSGLRIDMFNEIYNNNNNHKRDATIAEATIFHGCTLITNDKRLKNKVNKYFPGKAITYAEYKDVVYH